jgi:hypothetical protein
MNLLGLSEAALRLPPLLSMMCCMPVCQFLDCLKTSPVPCCACCQLQVETIPEGPHKNHRQHRGPSAGTQTGVLSSDGVPRLVELPRNRVARPHALRNKVFRQAC